MKETPRFEVSSGNVFADLGLRNPEELQAKADLVYEISRTIEEKGLTQAQAAEILGIDQPKVSALVRGRFAGFSMERLYRYLNALGKDIEIVVRSASPRRKDGPALRVVRVEGKEAARTQAPRKRSPSARRQRRANG
jgi:predicted XRE-type DNA-binding protein